MEYHAWASIAMGFLYPVVEFHQFSFAHCGTESGVKAAVVPLGILEVDLLSVACFLKQRLIAFQFLGTKLLVSKPLNGKFYRSTLSAVTG